MENSGVEWEGRQRFLMQAMRKRRSRRGVPTTPTTARKIETDGITTRRRRNNPPTGTLS
jgi:hypothetical protein